LASNAPLKASLTERVGLQFMRRQPSIPPVAPADDPIHVLNPDERRALSRIERHAVIRAALAGALSATASAIASMLAHISHPVDGVNVSWHNLVTYWGWVGAVTLVASVIEIAFLYWDALRAVHRMACAAGLQFDRAAERASDHEVLATLTRAALELPNPLNPFDGIDPRRETSAIVVVLISALYKAKVALTTFIVKALLRGALGRAAARAILDFAAVPVTALWDAIVCLYVLREARLRILGPSAVLELLQTGTQFGSISRDGWQLAERAVASAIVRTRDFHPNHLALLNALGERQPIEEVSEPDDTERFVRDLPRLPATEQAFVLRVLVAAAILDGRVTRAERRLLKQAFSACQRQLDLQQVAKLVSTFRAGQPVTHAILSTVD
jgi:hypothetical protein